MRLLLIRHGQTPSNVVGAVDTARPGPGLTDLGHAQARAVPAALDGRPIAAIYASPLLRTQLTAAPLASARGLGVRVQEGLEEISAGALEMRSDEESVQAYVDCLAHWVHGELDVPMPGGPDGRAFFERYDAAIGAIAAHRSADDTVVAVSHGAAMRVWVAARSLNAGPDLAVENRIMNTGMAVLDGDPGTGWTLVEWHGDPLGGAELEDLTAHDVTGDSAGEAVAEAD
jgi:probable phosphoglycerate mutase